MRSYERNGITVDQCTNCRGIYLDRGELERLIDAESAHYEQAGTEGGEQRGLVGKMKGRAEQKMRDQQQRRDRGEGGEGGFLGGGGESGGFLGSVFGGD